MSGQRQSMADLTNEQIEELRKVFDSIDQDGQGDIDLSELGTALHACGITLPGYSVRQLMEQYDLDKNNRLSINEFRKLLLKPEQILKPMAVPQKLLLQVPLTQWLLKNKSLGDDEECKDLLPMKDTELYANCKNGILFKLINTAVPNTIDERAINKGKLSVFRIDENLVLALQSAQAIGCYVVNIGPADIREGKKHLILGLLWQIIRIGLLSEITLSKHAGLVLLLEDDETFEDLNKLSPEQILLRWVNYHLRNAGIDRTITNFGDDIKDSEAYTYLLHQIAPADKGVSLAPLDLPAGEERAEAVLEQAAKIDCRSFVTAKDIVKGYQKLNLAFVANLFNTYPALNPPQDTDMSNIVEETREEKTYRNWMNSMGVKPFVTYLYTDLQDENCNYCIELGKQMKFSLVGIGGEDIRDGNQTLTLEDGHAVIDKEIIEWANETLKAKGKKAEDKLKNAKYAITMGRKIGARIYALPEDIVEIKPKMIMTIFACLMYKDMERKPSDQQQLQE
ncbi:hypothetical protein KUTeg_023303 [Tegillarca granosa]|uniref:Plastin-2 n=1 Tax=Tegillarca granosa TaxID=220873 RepID=A0ABQ9E186_TEGGR|nr:hypothetical protein KUTeg_023303 [Tegillarca granosa]